MVTAFILIITDTGKEKEVISKLLGIVGVMEAWFVYGDYDVLAKVKSFDLDTLTQLILQKIRNIPNISMTSTLIGID